ncbi:hypothetical protein [Serratia silvae]|uniref:Uncharacterized protein n=1 Tax=Serratia silvae TaxID=2824122 RepID=A0ABT0KEE9_9GAMM|nr:hypothetical protein [Serratia silvae]MCL1030287.1 hypothetical protein [Serratia silvae]
MVGEVVRVNRRAINAVAERKAVDTPLLKADIAYASFTEVSGPVRITGGFTHGTTTGKSRTGATVRVEIEPMPGETTQATFKVKGKFEVGSSPANMANFLLKNNFFEHMLALKISQFIGTIGEVNIVKKLMGASPRFHLYQEGATTATPLLNLNVVAGSVTHLQHSRTKNGLDIIAKVVNPSPPPPHFWAIFEIKTKAMHEKDVPPLAQYQGELAVKQREGIDYVIKTIEKALKANEKNPSGFIMDRDKIKEMRKLLFALNAQKINGDNRVLGFVIGQGIDKEYKAVKNSISSEGLQQITLWFGNKSLVKEKFGVDIMEHSQVVKNGSFN